MNSKIKYMLISSVLLLSPITYSYEDIVLNIKGYNITIPANKVEELADGLGIPDKAFKDGSNIDVEAFKKALKLDEIENSIVGDKINLDGSNLKPEDIVKLRETLGFGDFDDKVNSLEELLNTKLTNDPNSLTEYQKTKFKELFKITDLENRLNEVNTEIAPMLDGKANKDASNIEGENITKWQDKLNITELRELVETLQPKLNKDGSNLTPETLKKLKEVLNITNAVNKDELNNYLKIDGSNMDDVSKEFLDELIKRLTENSNIDDSNSNTFVKSNDVKKYLEDNKFLTLDNLEGDTLELFVKKLLEKNATITGPDKLLTKETFDTETRKLKDELISHDNIFDIISKDIVNSKIEKDNLKPISGNTAYNKFQEINEDISKKFDELRESSDKVFTNLKGGISSGLAMGMIPQVNGDKLVSVGVGAAYFDKTLGVALGLSGQDKGKNIVYKIAGGWAYPKSYSIGAGINYNFGNIDIIDEDIVQITDEKIQVLGEKLSLLERENEDLQKQVNQNNIEGLINGLEGLSDKDKELYLQKINNILENANNLSELNKFNQNNPDKIKGIKKLTIYFDFDKYNLTSKSKQQLIKLVENKNILRYEIKGYTDKVGTKDYNLSLSVKRAFAVDNSLNKNISTDIIRFVQGLGKTNFISNEDKLNRRAEIIIYYMPEGGLNVE